MPCNATQRPDYGQRRDYVKRDLYTRGLGGAVVYLGTTTWAQSAYEARVEYCRHHAFATLGDVWSCLNEKR